MILNWTEVAKITPIVKEHNVRFISSLEIENPGNIQNNRLKSNFNISHKICMRKLLFADTSYAV